MKKRAIISFVTIVAAAVFLLFGCTPAKRMANLAKNNPELADTTFTTKHIEVPEFHEEGSVNASADDSGLHQIIDKLGSRIDSLTKQALKTEIRNYIINRPCIDKPILVHLPEGGFVKIWQDAGQINYNVNIPKKKYSLTFPMLTFNLTYRLNWQSFAIGAMVGVFLLLMATMAFVKIKTQ